MLESEKFALASRLHVLLRRKVGRITDVEWMVRSREYAIEIIRIAREQNDDEFRDLADKCAAVFVPGPEAQRMSHSVPVPPPPPANAQPASPADPRNPVASRPGSRYMRGLR